jgi:hypothetical protein
VLTCSNRPPLSARVRGAAGPGIGQIERQQPATITAAAGGDELHPLGRTLAQGVAQLAGGAGEQRLHAVTSLGIEY